MFLLSKHLTTISENFSASAIFIKSIKFFIVVLQICPCPSTNIDDNFVTYQWRINKNTVWRRDVLDFIRNNGLPKCQTSSWWIFHRDLSNHLYEKTRNCHELLSSKKNKQSTVPLGIAINDIFSRIVLHWSNYDWN